MKWHNIKRSIFFSNLLVFQCSLPQFGGTGGTETCWSKAQQWGLVWSQARGACEEVNSMQKLFSYLLLCLQSACPVLPGQPWWRCWHSLCFCSPLGRAGEGAQCCPECCGFQNFDGVIFSSSGLWWGKSLDHRRAKFLKNKAQIYPCAKGLPYGFCEPIPEKYGISGHHLWGHCIQCICACLCEGERFLELISRPFQIPQQLKILFQVAASYCCEGKCSPDR